MSTQGRIFSQRLYSINLLVFNIQSVRLESAKVIQIICGISDQDTIFLNKPVNTWFHLKWKHK